MVQMVLSPGPSSSSSTLSDFGAKLRFGLIKKADPEKEVGELFYGCKTGQIIRRQ